MSLWAAMACRTYMCDMRKTLISGSDLHPGEVQSGGIVVPLRQQTAWGCQGTVVQGNAGAGAPCSTCPVQLAMMAGLYWGEV